MEFKAKEFVFLLVLGILIASLGLYSFVRGRKAEPIETSELTIMVHVAGCVNRPGLYDLPAQSRVAHAIIAAGKPGSRYQPPQPGRVSQGWAEGPRPGQD